MRALNDISIKTKIVGSLLCILVVTIALGAHPRAGGAPPRKSPATSRKPRAAPRRFRRISRAVNRATGETGAAATQVTDAGRHIGGQAVSLRQEVGRFLDDIRAA